MHPYIFLYIFITKATISQIYLSIELHMFRTDLLSIIRSLNTVFTANGICHTSYISCLLVDWKHN